MGAEGRRPRAPLSSHRPCSRVSGVEGREGLDGQQDGLHCPCFTEAARKVEQGVWPGTSLGGGGWGTSHEEPGSYRAGTPGHLAGVPASRAGIRLGRPVRTELGATPGRFGGLCPQEVEPCTTELSAVAQQTRCLPSGSPLRGSHLRDSSRSS